MEVEEIQKNNEISKFLYGSIEYQDILHTFPISRTQSEVKTLNVIAKTLFKLSETIESLKCCGNCKYDNTDTKNNGGCFGCKDTRSGGKKYHGWQPIK